jgi:hypothetical protein
MRIFRKTYLFTLCFAGVLSVLAGRATLVEQRQDTENENMFGHSGRLRDVAISPNSSGSEGDLHSDGDGSPPYTGALEIDWSKVTKPKGKMGALGFVGSFKKKASAKT